MPKEVLGKCMANRYPELRPRDMVSLPASGSLGFFFMGPRGVEEDRYHAQPHTSEVLDDGPAGCPAISTDPGDSRSAKHGEELCPAAKKI